jgi:hypothetical protein
VSENRLLLVVVTGGFGSAIVAILSRGHDGVLMIAASRCICIRGRKISQKISQKFLSSVERAVCQLALLLKVLRQEIVVGRQSSDLVKAQPGSEERGAIGCRVQESGQITERIHDGLRMQILKERLCHSLKAVLIHVKCIEFKYTSDLRLGSGPVLSVLELWLSVVRGCYFFHIVACQPPAQQAASDWMPRRAMLS